MNLKQIRYKNCKRRLFDGTPGFNIINNEPKNN